jgi:FkbM family methyltransferase
MGPGGGEGPGSVEGGGAGRVIGGRSAAAVLAAPFERRHYRALINGFVVYDRPLQRVIHYLTGRGTYPNAIELKTPLGRAKATLYSHHDLLTVNEVFCRKDYEADAPLRTVVDIGGNIGLSALYWLTRNPEAFVYAYEPVPFNCERLVKNLAGLEKRFELSRCAVADYSGAAEFGVEPSGRYGGLGKQGETIRVRVVSINEVLEGVLSRVDKIDLLKIDTEGMEVRTVEGIAAELGRRVRRIFFEANPPGNPMPELFERRQYGSVCRLFLKASGITK